MYGKSSDWVNGYAADEPPYGNGVRAVADEPATRWTDAAIAESNAAQDEWEAEMDMRDDYVRAVIEPLTQCPAVAYVHVWHTNAAKYAATSATYSREAPRWSLKVGLRRGVRPLDGEGETLGLAVAEVLAQVRVVVAAAGEGVTANAL